MIVSAFFLLIYLSSNFGVEVDDGFMLEPGVVVDFGVIEWPESDTVVSKANNANDFTTQHNWLSKNYKLA